MIKKVILDTDIGSDIDDAVCLAYLLSHPGCELLGITTVSGEPVKRAMLASALCKAAGKDIPILPGVEKPLFVSQKQPLASQWAALGAWKHDKVFPDGEAVEFLRTTIRKYPGEITLLAIGPLTNIALLFSIDPEIPKLLKELVLMCGIFTNRLAGAGPLEWNAVCDPHAAAIVYNTQVNVHRSIGLDVTLQVSMNKDEVNKKFQSKILKPVADFSKVWFEKAGLMYFHDPLAAATIFDPNICTFHSGNVDVELDSQKLAGLTHWKADASGGRHEVALEVDQERFIEHYFSVVNR